MSSELVVGLLSLLGTLAGSLGGILTASRLTNFRLSRLEEKVDKHNSFGQRIPVIEEKIKVVNHRLEDLEEVMGK